MPELSPEVFPRLVGELIASGNEAIYTAVARVVNAVQKEARSRLAESSHAYGEPTGASKGGPPALVSGTLRRSVVTTEPKLVGPMTWEAKCGLAAGFYPPYGKGRTESARYGLYLETVWGYPFMVPAWREVMRGDGPKIMGEAFRSTRWPHIV